MDNYRLHLGEHASADVMWSGARAMYPALFYSAIPRWCAGGARIRF